MIPPTLARPGAALFWLAVILTGIGAGLAAAVLTLVAGAGAAYLVGRCGH